MSICRSLSGQLNFHKAEELVSQAVPNKLNIFGRMGRVGGLVLHMWRECQTEIRVRRGLLRIGTAALLNFMMNKVKI